jgi:5,6-dimethylbenzimidazole synthase
MNNAFSISEKAAVYRAIHERRDVRSQFLPDVIPNEVLSRLLAAAHAAPSVGFMQPWDFIVIDDLTIRRRIKDNFDCENSKAACNYSDNQKSLYQQLKLEGIIESPINICITCDRARGGEHVLGRDSVIDMDLFSACLAVQNFWLAARAEGVGVGWVSILNHDLLSQQLNLPENIYPLAYLCVGYVSEFLTEPELAIKGWRQRLPLEQLIHYNQWSIKEPSL